MGTPTVQHDFYLYIFSTETNDGIQIFRCAQRSKYNCNGKIYCHKSDKSKKLVVDHKKTHCHERDVDLLAKSVVTLNPKKLLPNHEGRRRPEAP